MAVCCIGGVCIPYTALIPLLLYGLKWLLEKLVTSGLLPKSWHEKIVLFIVNATSATTRKLRPNEETATDETSNLSSSSCCINERSSSRIRRRHHDVSDKIAKNASIIVSDDQGKRQKDNDNVEEEIVITIKNSEQWDGCFRNIVEDNLKFARIVICKFTADWCKPCKEIHPHYVELAKTHSNGNIQFCVIDVDNDQLEDVVGTLGVAILPTFCSFGSSKNKPINKYVGSDPNKINEFVENVIGTVAKD
jgi:thiol-disulfide isomerase/thioredoxin